jgi:hypothetical protein
MMLPGAGGDEWYSIAMHLGRQVTDDPEPLIRSSPALQDALDRAEARGDFRLHERWTSPVTE